MATEVVTTTITKAVTSGVQINNQQFQGWYIHPDGSLEAINCPTSQTLFTTQNYAECCDIGATTCSTFWTSCSGTYAIGVSTNACGPSSTCSTVSIFDQFPINGAQVHSQIICAPPAWAASSIYRAVITSETSTALSTITSDSASAGATSSTASSTSGASSSAISSTSGVATQTSSPSSSSSSPSKAWIAGAVIGPIAAIIIIALLVWIYRLRKRQHGIGEGYNQQQPAHMHSSHDPKIMEMQASQHDPRFEMYAGQPRKQTPYELS